MRWRQAGCTGRGEERRDEARLLWFFKENFKEGWGVFFLSVIIVGTHTH